MTSTPLARNIARRLPSPQHVGWPLRVLPWPIQRGLLEKLLNSHFQALLAAGEFDFLEQRSLGVEVSDLRLRWVFGVRDRRLELLPRRHAAEATIRGRGAEFLLLLGRLEDPDTLFFQRRLEVTGDTTIGLTTRNLLDRLCWEDLPLALRILLNRAGRFGQTLREVRT
ncbi:MAG: SCP2 domain-containing protein [Gammaproteobacteria bacterium HGW-Gammaproteobacteria-8]|nr:MAG: SCP2 domain-containing protein [Gammaproteobacteria bacterium HGW-Gammaproteobacteria-8]